jgi:hypothetical protein
MDYSSFPDTTIHEKLWQHAQEGLYLLNEHYRTRYTCRYMSTLQMMELLHFSDAIARFFPNKVDSSTKNGEEAISFGLEALRESREGFPVARTLQEMLQRTAVECKIPLPRSFRDSVSAKKAYIFDKFIEACTRPSYKQPVKDIQSRFRYDFSADWFNNGPKYGFRDIDLSESKARVTESEEERRAQNLMNIRNLLTQI